MSPNPPAGPTVEDVWAASDYAPTAERLAPVAARLARRVAELTPPPARVLDVGAGHGHLAAALLDEGYAVTALEPTPAMRRVGERAVPAAAWLDATAEETGLPAASADILASSFGWMFGDPARSAAEARRVLAPGGRLVFTVWTPNGFLHEMTERMNAALGAGGAVPPHLAWGRPEVCRERLRDFADVRIEPGELAWSFPDVASGLRLYRDGSPAHAFTLAHAGQRADALARALEEHLREHADPQTGRIDAVANYAIVTATRPADG